MCSHPEKIISEGNWVCRTCGHIFGPVEGVTSIAPKILPVTIRMERREDGGLRVWGEPPGGLILSGPDPERVIASIWSALGGLQHPITK